MTETKLGLLEEAQKQIDTNNLVLQAAATAQNETGMTPELFAAFEKEIKGKDSKQDKAVKRLLGSTVGRVVEILSK